eukprot:TRINITY_DN36260_c0_g2_i1.p1 TRINITY_DN36260_c0_g2~~TRINITY_DN36260_c0_g2_i1.p1  ORF type:complete len:719 (+),score=169.29 TRINITY_DN36260_c0_g2_i1:120-2276(+)
MADERVRVEAGSSLRFMRPDNKPGMLPSGLGLREPFGETKRKMLGEDRLEKIAKTLTSKGGSAGSSSSAGHERQPERQQPPPAASHSVPKAQAEPALMLPFEPRQQAPGQRFAATEPDFFKPMAGRRRPEALDPSPAAPGALARASTAPLPLSSGGGGRSLPWAAAPAKNALGPAADDARSPEGRARYRQQSRGRLVALNEFRRWYGCHFRSAEALWSAIAGSLGALDEKTFVDALVSMSYPNGRLGAKTAFLFLDPSGEGVVSFEDLSNAMEEVAALPAKSPGMQYSDVRRSPKTAKEEQPSLLEGMDFFEAEFQEEPATKSVLEKRHKILSRLQSRVPAVAEFLAYLFAVFGTLRVAFRHLDVARRGFLTMGDFKEGVRTVNVQKNCVRPLEAHVEALWSRLAPRLTGPGGKSGGLMAALDSNFDPMVKRLRGFLDDLCKKETGKNSSEHGPDDAARKKWFNFFVGHVNSEAEFQGILIRLQYLDWHMADLFHKLDQDGAGQITVDNLTEFLTQMPRVGTKPWTGYREPEAGGVRRKYLVNGGDVYMNTSCKLVRNDGKREGFGDAPMWNPTYSLARSANKKSLRASIDLTNTGWTVEERGRAVVKPRSKTLPTPDAQFNSTLFSSGVHKMSASAGALRDLAAFCATDGAPGTTLEAITDGIWPRRPGVPAFEPTSEADEPLPPPWLRGASWHRGTTGTSLGGATLGGSSRFVSVQ